jgi:hypothetical protein
MGTCDDVPMPELFASPTRIPVPGGMVIDEHVGRESSGTDAVSVVHMVAPDAQG